MTMEYGELFYKPSRWIIDARKADAFVRVATQMGMPASVLAHAGEIHVSQMEGIKEVVKVEEGKAYVELDHQMRDLTDFWRTLDS